MSGRVLGGGRIIGNGQPLSSPVKSRHQRILSPTPSSISVESRASSLQFGLENGGASSATSAASPRLICPICNEEMVTLLQLNQHLDDIHRDLEDEEQDDIKAWFRKRITKAKQFQPVAVLNQKLKGLDVFESNDSPASPASLIRPEPRRTDSPRIIPDEVVTRQHWHRNTANDLCSEPTCGKYLNPVNGNINCRKCGRLFCEMHTMYQMKLSRSAQHEPVRGMWCRVCETCYKSREGYNDHHGFERDHMAELKALRQPFLSKARLEVSRLERRLTNLTQLLAGLIIQQNTTSTYLWQLTGGRNERKQLEQSVVTWEEDSAVLVCPYCKREFSGYGIRRHHCRLCGKVICGEPDTDCSSEVSLDVVSSKSLPSIPVHTDQLTASSAADTASEKTSLETVVGFRMCKSCNHTIFSEKDFHAALRSKPPDQKSYETLLQFQQGIKQLLPRFQALSAAIRDQNQPPSKYNHNQNNNHPQHIPSATELAEAKRVRKRLLDAFAKYDAAAKRIRALPTASAAQEKLQRNVHLQASTFLHLHMLSLRSLPKALRHKPGASLLGVPDGFGTGLGAGTDSESAGSRPGSDGGGNGGAAAGEERGLRERLIVLEEQRFLVQEMMVAARRARRFDEVSALGANADDLAREIGAVTEELDRLNLEEAGIGR